MAENINTEAEALKKLRHQLASQLLSDEVAEEATLLQWKLAAEQYS